MTTHPGEPAPTPAETRLWTFVLHEPCDACGFTGGRVTADEAVRRLRAARAAWEEALAHPDARTRPAPDVWSPVEYACHVRDLCRLAPARLASIVAFDEPALPDWDQDDAAVANAYWRADPADVGDDLGRWTGAAVSAVAAVPASAWSRLGRRSDGVVLSAADLVTLLVHETEHHLHDVGRLDTARRRAADETAITAVVDAFFSAFVSGPGAATALDRLREVLLPSAVIVRTCGQELAVYDVEGFIAPRASLLASGDLVDFREWVTGGRTDVFGDVAQHWCSYAKSWTRDGMAEGGRGMKSVQLVRTPAGWRISAAAWDDERPGVPWPGAPIS